MVVLPRLPIEEYHLQIPHRPAQSHIISFCRGLGEFSARTSALFGLHVPISVQVCEIIQNQIDPEKHPVGLLDKSFLDFLPQFSREVAFFELYIASMNIICNIFQVVFVQRYLHNIREI
jgi:hypothetical protein